MKVKVTAGICIITIAWYMSYFTLFVYLQSMYTTCFDINYYPRCFITLPLDKFKVKVTSDKYWKSVQIIFHSRSSSTSNNYSSLPSPIVLVFVILCILVHHIKNRIFVVSIKFIDNLSIVDNHMLTLVCFDSFVTLCWFLFNL